MEEKLQVLQSLYEYIPKLYDANEHTIENLRDEYIKEVYEVLVPMTQGLQWCIEAIYLTNECHSINVDLEEVQAILKEMLEAIENNDTILLKDILEYEIKERLELWYAKIEAVIEV